MQLLEGVVIPHLPAPAPSAPDKSHKVAIHSAPRLDAASMHMPAVFLRSLKASRPQHETECVSCYPMLSHVAGRAGAAPVGCAVFDQAGKGRGWAGVLRSLAMFCGFSQHFATMQLSTFQKQKKISSNRILPPVPMTEIVDQTELIEASSIIQLYAGFGRGSEPICL